MNSDDLIENAGGLLQAEPSCVRKGDSRDRYLLGPYLSACVMLPEINALLLHQGLRMSATSPRNPIA